VRKGPGPRSNAAKTRAWQQRSAVRAAANARAKQAPRVMRKGRQQLVPGQLGAKPPPPSPSPKGRVEFRGMPLAGRSCAICLRLDRSRPARQWHHWIAQQHIRAYVDSLRIRDETQERAVTRRLLHDERNLSPVCFACHDSHENVANGPKFTAADVPESAHAFAAELGAWYVARLEHDYL
jgi:hypothetical protein